MDIYHRVAASNSLLKKCRLKSEQEKMAIKNTLNSDSPPNEADQFPFVPPDTVRYLSYRQCYDYNEFRRKFAIWCREKGKEQDKNKGLSERTVKTYLAYLNKGYLTIWEEFDEYTSNLTQANADWLIDQLANDRIHQKNGEPYAEASKRKFSNSLKKYFEWLHHERSGKRWEPKIEFREKSSRHADEFTIEERRKLRNAVLEYKAIPSYKSVTPEERNRIKGLLAQRLGKPKNEVSPADWRRENLSWKWVSLVRSTLDGGLRPIEIERAEMSWVRFEKGELHIPREESAKNREYWEVALRSDTIESLERWRQERASYPEYDETDYLWLNRQNNPYNAGSLPTHFDNLCEIAEIDRTNRDLSWYSFRHSLGTHMTSKGNLLEAKEQLRHKSLESTRRYVHPTTEDRCETLDKIS